jgi:hypothetical protein
MRFKKITAATAAEASAKFCALRDASGLGASKFSDGDWQGNRISYNGKVWAGLEYTPGDTPIFDPYA